MKRNKLDGLRREWEGLRRAPQKTIALQRLARKLGRELSNRGKHPVWVSKPFPSLRPLSIPNHPGDLAPGTKASILDQLVEDLVEWEARLEDATEGEEEQ